MPQPCRPMRDALRALVVSAAILAAGCASLPDHGMAAEIPPAPLRLVSASNVDLPRDCRVRGGAVYRTNFVVHGDGRVADIQPEPAPACLQAALANQVRPGDERSSRPRRSLRWPAEANCQGHGLGV